MALTILESGDAFDNVTDYNASGRYTYDSASTAGVATGITGNALTIRANSSAYLAIPFNSAYLSFYMGFHFKFTAIHTSAERMFLIRETASETDGLILFILPTGYPQLNRSSGLLASSSAPILGGKWYHMAVYISIANSGGRFVLYLNGVAIIDFTGDTAHDASPTGALGPKFWGGSGGLIYYDNMWMSDTTNYGQKTVGIYRPTADGNYSQFTTSTGVTHYTLVDETDVSGADYVKDSTAGHRESFKFAEYSGSNAISAVAVSALVNKDMTDDRTIKLFTRFSSTDDDGSILAPSVSSYICFQRAMPTNPITTLAWQPTDLQGGSRAEFGVKIEA